MIEILIKDLSTNCFIQINNFFMISSYDNLDYLLKGFLPLDNDKNIIIKQSVKKRNVIKSKIYIYDNSLNEVKIIVDDSPMINDYYKINKDLFVYSIEKKMIFKKFDGEDISDREIIIREPYITFLYYYVKDKILFAEGNLIIYLIKLNISNPEVFQKINLENNMHTIKYRYHFFDEDSIYLR